MHKDLMTVDVITTQLRVDAGMEFLDRKTPGWEHYVRLPSLELSDGSNCILGQIGQEKFDSEHDSISGYCTLVGELKLDVDTQESLGFFCSNPFNYELLNEVWRDKIKERLRAKKPKVESWKLYTNENGIEEEEVCLAL
jgi:hypothetical protein